MPGTASHAVPPAWIFSPPEAARTEIWGLTPEERLRRSLAAAGADRVESLEGDGPAPAPASALLLRGDFVYDDRLVRGLLASPGALLLADAGEDGSGGVPVAAHVSGEQWADALALVRAGKRIVPGTAPSGLHTASPAALAPSYSAALRKAEPPILLATAAAPARAIEERLFSASYKGITDLVTKWLWPRPAATVTRWLARAHVHPNTVTAASWLAAVLAAVLFWKGAFVGGLLAAWLMTFLDTVDGKLARVTLTSSKLGNVLDHGLDLVHPPFWYLAWGLALPAGLEWATAIAVLGYFAGRAQEGLFLLAFHMETHSWRPVDSLFRTITARRNPNLILLTVGTLGGRPDLGMAMVAIWTGISLAFHSVRLIQAFAAKARGNPVRPWDESGPGGLRPTGELG